MQYQCDNCEFTAPETAFPAAKNIEMRITPGEIYTDKECPECGALAHPYEDLTWRVWSEHDGNDAFEVQGAFIQAAAINALEALGWNLSAEPVKPETDQG